MGAAAGIRRPVIAAVLAAAPLLPDPDDARDWARRELSDPAYAAAEPTPLDRIARAVGEALARLFDPQLSGGWGTAASVIVTVVVVAVILSALLIWGRPRSRARVRAAAAPLFGETDARSAAQLRADAAAEAARGDWDAAVVLRFRALARALAERVLVDPAPGTTAQGFARSAAAVFPARRDALADAAATFDDVRYLRRPATRDAYERVAALDDALAAERPQLQAVPA